MVSFAAAAARRDQRWVPIVTIEGIGDYAGQWKLCSEVPTYASGDATYKPWLREMPGILSESVDPVGGVAKSGELSFDVVDIDDAITAALRSDRAPTTELNGALTAGATSATVKDGSGITAGSSVIYIGAEAIRVVARSGNSLSTITRAWLGTDAAAHADTNPVLLSTPYLRSRRVRLYLTPGDGDSSTDETLMGTYHLDGIALSPDLGSYQITARSQQSYLGRLVCSTPRRYRVRGWTGSPALPVLILEKTDTVAPPRASNQDWPGSDEWCRVGKEILRGNFLGGGTNIDHFQTTARGQAGTEPAEIKVGDVAAQVYVSDMGTHGSFRFSPGPSPSTSRASGTWTVSANWVDLMLALMTSSFDSADGLELTNYNGSGTPDAIRSNWSSLPIGVGAGIAVARIDVESFIKVRNRTMGYNFPALIIGDESMPLATLLEKHFLRPIGANLTISNDKLSLILRRSPLADEATTAVGNDSILADSEEGGGSAVMAPRLSAQQDMALLISSVVFNLTDADGTERKIIGLQGDSLGLYGPAAYYASDTRSLELDLPSARTDAGGVSAFVQNELVPRLLDLFGRPLWRVTFETDISLHGTYVGTVFAVSNAELPNTLLGTRGWTSVPCAITERTLVLGEHGASFRWVVLGSGHLPRTGRIAPSAIITSVVSNTATVAANRYTSTDASGELPSTDASAFTAGDILALAALDGVRSGSTQTISSITGNDIALNGNFGGTLASGKVLIYADRGDAAAQQYNSFVYWADRTNHTVGSSTDTVWRYSSR